MSIISRLSSAFGFSSDPDDDIIADDPMSETATEDRYNGIAPTENIEDAAAVDRIFEHVVRVFNQNLPEFLRNSVDEKAQRQNLYAMLDADVKAYLVRLRETVEHENRQRWDKEKLALQANLREFEQRTREFDEQRRDITQKHLAADRQRRSLADKISTLENRNAQLEAEIEQVQLENKSLVNKVKVMQVYEKEVDELRTALQSANDGIAVAEIPTTSQIADYEKRVEELQHELQLRQTLLDEQSDALNKCRDELRDLREENKQAEAMLNDVAHIEKQINQFETIKRRYDDRIASLEKQLAEQTQVNASLQKKLDAQAEAPALSQPKLIETSATPIEDILSDATDWPGQKKSSQRGRNRNDKSREKPRDDGQLSLFN